METQDEPLLDQIKQSSNKSERVTLLFKYLKEKGQSKYDEAVTQYEHAVQSACLANNEQAGNELVVAALFHDIGHLIADEHKHQTSFLNDDLYHEEVAASFLADLFPQAVIDPIRLHVPAKRFLCTIDSTYYDQLSKASKKSFQLQGGFMSDEQVREFKLEPHHQAALRLRRWDDLAKVQNKKVPEIEAYESVVSAVLL